ncbi:MAG: hypothetical protein ACLSA0_10400 [Eisenbergiella massiliensis]
MLEVRGNMITAVFTDGDDCVWAYGLWQWDYGQQLRIEGLHLPTVVEIHFSLQEAGGEAVPRVGVTKDGVTTVTIPDSMLEGAGAVRDYQVYAWVYLSDRTFGETTKQIMMKVKARSKPKAFEAPGDGEIFRQAIEAVNDAAKRAEDAGDKAVVAADEAEKAATQTAEHLQATEGLAEQVETNADTVAQDKQAVAGMLSQTQQAASDAALSAQAAKLSETAAVQAQTGAEAAEDGARQYAEETGADRQAVANDKQVVSQMREAVAADRQAVEQTAAQFGQTAQDALTAIGQAQSTAVGAVKAEGNKQTTAVQEAGTQAVREVAEAKTTAVQAVTTEGDKQTKRVEDAAAGIIADREQINQNKADIAGLVEGMTDLAPAILNTASDSVITADDAAEDRPFRGLRVFGKSTQDGTPTPEAPIPIVSAGEDGSIEVKVTGKNLLTGRLYYIDYSMGAGFIKNENEVSLPYAPKSETSGIGYVIPCAPEKHYAFSVTNPNENAVVAISEYKTLEDAKNKENAIGFVVPSLASPYKSVYTSKGNGVLVCWIAGKWTDGKTTIHECTESELLQLEIGSEATTYEPYRTPQILTLQTPNGLPGVPVSKDGNYTDQNGQQWVCDEIDLGRGKYVQRIEEHILKSKNITSITNSRQINSEYYGIEYNGCTKDFVGKFGNGVLCDKLAFVKPNSNINGHEITYAPGNGIIVFGLKKSLVPSGDLDEIRNYITSNNFAFLILIDSPIEKDLTPEEITEYKKTHTNYPTTVITNDAGAHMEVSYVADTGIYIRNMESRLSAQLVNIQSALISQKTSGGHLTIADSSPLPVEEFSMTGKTIQIQTTGKNLLKPNDYNVYHELPLKAGTVVTLMTNGQLSEGGNIKFIGMENENVWFAIDKGQTRVCHSIGNKDVKGFYNLLTKKEGLEYMLAIGDVKIFEPYSGSFPSPSPDWEQPIEITDQPITITIKGGTEQQSITLTPPRPFTKWDRLEKIDGVWCWVYQSKVLPGAEIKKNFMGMHNSGSMMIKISTLGAMDEQNDAVSDKFIYSTQSVSTLKNGEFRIIYGNAYLKIDGITTDEEGRQWLESNDIIIIAQASAPEYIPLAASEQAQLNALTMYAGTTEITNNGGCTMDLTYTADTKTYIDNKLAAISAAMIGGT